MPGRSDDVRCSGRTGSRRRTAKMTRLTQSCRCCNSFDFRAIAQFAIIDLFDVVSREDDMNRRELMKDVGIATGAASLLAVGAARAQGAAVAVNVLVAYHSVTGNTEKMAQGVAEGAKEVPGANVV